MKDENFSLLVCLIFTIVASMILHASWEAHLNDLNKKPTLKVVKEIDPKYVSEQMQGLINDINK